MMLPGEAIDLDEPEVFLPMEEIAFFGEPADHPLRFQPVGVYDPLAKLSDAGLVYASGLMIDRFADPEFTDLRVTIEPDTDADGIFGNGYRSKAKSGVIPARDLAVPRVVVLSRTSGPMSGFVRSTLLGCRVRLNELERELTRAEVSGILRLAGHVCVDDRILIQEMYGRHVGATLLDTSFGAVIGAYAETCRSLFEEFEGMVASGRTGVSAEILPPGKYERAILEYFAKRDIDPLFGEYGGLD